MLRTRSIITTISAIALALAAPATAGAQQDLRSPDAKEAAAAAAGGGHHLRSPDATAAATEPGQDLRSPDARDAARPEALTQAPDQLAPVDRAPDGFRWGDAGIGAVGALGLGLALGGLALLTAHQRRRDQVPVARH